MRGRARKSSQPEAWKASSWACTRAPGTKHNAEPADATDNVNEIDPKINAEPGESSKRPDDDDDIARGLFSPDTEDGEGEKKRGESKTSSARGLNTGSASVRNYPSSDHEFPSSDHEFTYCRRSSAGRG